MSVETWTSVTLSEVESAFKTVTDHIAEHGIDPDPAGPADVRFRHEGAVIRLQHDKSDLRISLEAPSGNMLYFLKEAVALHVAEIDPLAAEDLRWSDQSGAVARPVNFCELTLLERSTPFPGMTRLTLSSDDAAFLADDGLHVKLMLPAERTRTPVWPSVSANGVTRWPEGPDRLHVRYFTLRALRPEAGEVDIDVVQHPGGMISDWALKAQAGERIGVMGPGGGQAPAQKDGLLLAGDETALPAIARILEACGPDASGHLVVAFPADSDPDSYLPSTSLKIHSLPPQRFRAEVLPLIQKVGSEERIANAWFGGEYTNAQALRQVFKQELGLGKGQQLSVAYWREGVRGDARRESDD